MMKCFAAMLVLLLASITLAAQSQNPPPPEVDADDVLRFNTTLVTVPLTVKNRAGGYIANLRREDFRIYEDRIEQEIVHFETPEAPVTVALLVDVSDSTQIKLKNIQDAAIAFVKQLHPDDRIVVIAFDKRVITLAEFTADRTVVSNAIRSLQTGGGTSLYDAIETALTDELRQINGRKAVVLLTDGMDTSSTKATFETSLQLIQRLDTLIYPIQYNSYDDLRGKQLSSENNQTGAAIYTMPNGEPIYKAYERATRYLRLTALTSGGRFYEATSLKNLERSFAQIAEELRQQYVLGYYPKNQGSKKEKRRITLTVSNPDGEVHARESYVYKSDQSPK
jgi:Ca-activated chloride channel family protein